MQKRYYFTLLLFICILSGHAQTIVLSPEDKKIFLKNFQTVLQHLPTKFAKIKTGGEDWDITNRISWYKSNLQLLPGQADKNKNQLMYGTYNSKPVIAFIEEVPVDVNTIVDILMPVLKAKGMVEVNTKYVMDDPAARSFRSNAAVLQINTNVKTSGSIINIGKFPYYYESDVKPITSKPAKKEATKIVTKPEVNVQKPADELCNGLKKIIKESGNAFKDVRFNKEEDEEMNGTFFYDTKLPKLGFEYIRIVEEKALQNEKGIKTIYSCLLSSDINSKTEAETKYKQLINAVTGCVVKTGEAKKSENILQWYAINMDENGQRKEIKIMLTHYNATSSLSLEVFYFSKEEQD